MPSFVRPAFLVVLLLLCAALAGCGRASAQGAAPDPLADAFAAAGAGDTARAVEMLRAARDAVADGSRERRDLTLALGGLLVDEERDGEAAPLLRDLEAGALAPYARLLFVKAVARGHLAADYDAAAARAAELARDPALPGPVRERAQFHAVKLAELRHDDAAVLAQGREYLARWAEDEGRDEVTWLAANAAERLHDDATAAAWFGTLWHDRPGNPWGRPAKLRLAELVAARRARAWTPAPAARRAFIERLQRVGLHEDALAETALYRRATGAAGRAAAAHLEAESLLALRRNADCVRTVQEARRLAPRAADTAEAALLAIRALRRDERSADVREWVAWLQKTHPGTEEARQAEYDLGVHLVNANRLDEGASILERVAAGGGKLAPDALWKVAWAYRAGAHDDRAADALARLLARFPTSAYRKSATYWSGRLAEAGDAARAKTFFASVVREFPLDYYGQEAARRLAALGEPPARTGQATALPALEPLPLLAKSRPDPLLDRALALQRVGLYAFAADAVAALPPARRTRSTWFALASLHASAGEIEAAQSILAREFGEFARAGSSDPALVPPEFWRVRFPFPLRSLVERTVRSASQGGASPAPTGAGAGASGAGGGASGVDAALVAALIRSESNFAAHAVSGAGAIGLMQLMPADAAALGRKRGLPPPTREDLFDPATNVLYGTAMIGERLADFGGDPVPAICSYNAGLGPVRQWWAARPPNQPRDEFIETIPYQETRLYVKQVLADAENYRRVYGTN